MTCCRFRLTHECEVRQVVILMNQFQLIVYMNTNGKQWLWSAIPHINIFAGMGLTVNTWERNCARIYYNILQKATDCIFSDLVEEDQIGSCKWHCLAAYLQAQCTTTNSWGIHMHTFNSNAACSLFLFLHRLDTQARQLAFLKRWCNMQNCKASVL